MAKLLDNNETFFQDILDNIHRITMDEFEKGKYEYKENNKVIKKKNNKGDMMMNYHRNKILQSCYQKMKKNEKKGKNNVIVDTVEEEEVNILRDKNIFNIIKDKSKLIDWKKLDNETQIKKVKIYLIEKEINLNEEIQEKLFGLINENKIKSKKYVEYDSILEKILALPILYINKKTEQYDLNYSTAKKKKKKKISFK